jgi:hypothetical protein
VKKTYKFFVFAPVLDSDVWFTGSVDYLEGEVLDVRLDFWVGKLPADKTLGVEDTRRMKYNR